MMHTPTRASRTRPTKLKSVTFTGCWTCRSRKVKCDERQEGGCGVCEKAGRTCDGYGVNLSWVTTERKQNLHGLRRRTIKLDRHAFPSLSDREITTTLSAIDNISAPSSTVVMGPFAIFRPDYSDTNPFAKDCRKPPARMNDCEDTNKLNTLYMQHDARWSTETDRTDPSPAVHCRTETGTVEELHRALEAQVQDSSDEESVPTAPSQPELSRSAVRGSELTTLPRPGTPQIPSPSFDLSMPLFRDHQTSMLMHHYVNHVAELLQPILHPRNPWRTTYFPFALEGCSEVSLYHGTGSSSSFASTALFNGVLSAAAFHLRNGSDSPTVFHQLGLQHRIKALRALNAAVVHPSEPHLHVVYLTAMLSLVTIDTLTGEDSDFPIHLEACRQLREPPSYTSHLVSSTSQVYSIYRFLSLLARTTSHVIKPRLWRTNSLTLELPYFRDDERSIEYMYGITPMLGNLLQSTCQLAEYLTFYERRGEQLPLSLQEACQHLGDKICAWTIESEPFHLIQSRDGTMFKIAQCQARAFHGAVFIYYHRTVQEGGAAAITFSIDVEVEVRAIWENLAVAENLKDAFMGGSKRTAPMSWPAFIGACEATDRQPWTEWWTRVEGYRVGNLARQWRIIRELWSVMDSDKSVTGWREALRRTGKLVLPI